jgi:hypothetical protein
MNQPIEDRLRAHFSVLGSQRMPVALQDRLLERRRRRTTTPGWIGLVVGMATAAVIFAAIAVPLLARTNAGTGPATGGTSLAAIRADFARLVITDSTSLGKNMATAQRACAGAATLAQETSTCITTINALSTELVQMNTAFNAATVPGGVATQMAQLVQALGSFASAYYIDSTQPASVVITDATTVQTDLRIVQEALANG